jgi:hypothetical protein
MSPWEVEFKAADKADGTGNIVTQRLRILGLETDEEQAADADERLDGYEDPPHLARMTIDIEFWHFLVLPDKRFLTDRSNPLRPQDGKDFADLLKLLRRKYTWITDCTLPRYAKNGQGYFNDMFLQPMLVAKRDHSKNKGGGILECTLTLAKRNLEQ